MRIGIDAWGLSGAIEHTGIGQYTSHLISQLSSLEPSSTIIAYGAPNEPRPASLPASVVWRAPDARVRGRAQALASRLFVLRRHVEADSIDVFHAPGVHVRASLPPTPSLRCPVVATVHDLIPVTYYRETIPARLRMFYRWNLRRALKASAVVTVSEASRQEILAYMPDLAPRLVVIPNGVDFAPNRDSEAIDHLGIRPPYILYAGSYEPRKNIGTALSAYARLAAEGLPHQLVAIVEAHSGHAPAVEAHLASLRLGDRVRLVHGLPETDLRALYTHAAALCFPSLAEGFGFPPLQAATCGTPVVASDLPSIRETLGEHALYVDTTNVELLANAIRRLLRDDELRGSLVEGARRRAQVYSWERSARAHWQLYEAVAASQRESNASISIEATS